MRITFRRDMAGLSVTFEDLESVDPDLYRGKDEFKSWNGGGISVISDASVGFVVVGLLFFKTNPLDPTEESDITFVVKHSFAGNLRTVELKPGGSEIMVTEENKHEYIELMTQYVMPCYSQWLAIVHLRNVDVAAGTASTVRSKISLTHFWKGSTN